MLRSEPLRYLAAGGANTVLTYALYLLLLHVVTYRVAYLVAFIAGIGLSFLLLRHAVFSRPGRPLSFVLVMASHLLQLGLGLWIVELWVTWLGGPAGLAPLAALLVCTPIMYALHRWIFPRARP